jgi:class III poly(R)-hydroxyalkanoic acid synthase PhaE subunit
MQNGEDTMTERAFEPFGSTEAFFRGQQELFRHWLGAFGRPDAVAANPFSWFAPFLSAATPARPPADGAARGPFDDYFGLTRALWDTIRQAAQSGEGQRERAKAFSEGLAKVQRDWQGAWLAALGVSRSAGASEAHAASSDARGFFGMPGLGMLNPASMADPTAVFGPWVQAWQRGLASYDLPALGLTRERQEAAQRLADLARTFLDVQSKLAAQWVRVWQEGIKDFGEVMAQRLAAGETPDSLKSLYDAWVESAERAFARVAHSAEYVKAQADLANTMSALRIEQQQLVESWLRQLDLPTRSELNSLHLRVKALKRELRRLEGALAAGVAARGAPPAHEAPPPRRKSGRRPKRAGA